MTIVIMSIAESGLEVLQEALSTWVDYYNRVITILTTSPQDFNSAVWQAMTTINSYITAIAVATTIIFFYIGLTKSTLHFEELRRPEKFFGYFVRLLIAEFIVTKSMDLLIKVLEIIQGIIVGVVDNVQLSNISAIMLPQEIINASNQVGTIYGLGVLIVAVIGGLVIWALSLMIMMIVYLRFFKIYIFAAVAPLPLSTLGGESTSRTARSFIMNYIGACLQGVIIAIAFIIFAKIITSGYTYDDTASAVSNLLKYEGTVIIQMLLLVATIKGSEKIVKEMVGV